MLVKKVVAGYPVPHLKTIVRTVRLHLSVHICSGCTVDAARVEDK